MDETTTIETATQQEQLAQLQAKVEGLRATPAEPGIDATAPSPQTLMADSAVPIDLEKTPEFEVWKQAKIQECLNYLRNNWKMDITVERLVMKEMYVFPNPDNPKSHASVHNGYNYIDPATGIVAINPATGRRMSYAIWREIDPPATVPAEVPAPTDTVK